MSAAFVIEVRGLQAGVIVRVSESRFRFFAAVDEAFALEGFEFASPVDAKRAAEQALSRAKPGRRA